MCEVVVADGAAAGEVEGVQGQRLNVREAGAFDLLAGGDVQIGQGAARECEHAGIGDCASALHLFICCRCLGDVQ